MLINFGGIRRKLAAKTVLPGLKMEISSALLLLWERYAHFILSRMVVFAGAFCSYLFWNFLLLEREATDCWLHINMAL